MLFVECSLEIAQKARMCSWQQLNTSWTYAQTEANKKLTDGVKLNVTGWYSTHKTGFPH